MRVGPVDFGADFFSHMVLRFDGSRGNGGWRSESVQVVDSVGEIKAQIYLPPQPRSGMIRYSTLRCGLEGDRDSLSASYRKRADAS